ncbi:uncharacterized protein [Drosophila bipectinata]|uniref:uncharacterized protein n=1 Tax=Drosophila bipectinata TaxID=42026 RepID=UPI0038B25D56
MRGLFLIVGLLLMTSANAHPGSYRNLICNFLNEVATFQRNAYSAAIHSTKTVVTEMINDLSTCEGLQPQMRILKDYLDRGKSISSRSSIEDQQEFLAAFPSNFNLTSKSLENCMHAPPMLGRTILGFVSSAFCEFPELEKRIIKGGNHLKEELDEDMLAQETQLFQLLDNFEKETDRVKRNNLADQISKMENNCL